MLSVISITVAIIVITITSCIIMINLMVDIIISINNNMTSRNNNINLEDTKNSGISEKKSNFYEDFLENCYLFMHNIFLYVTFYANLPFLKCSKGIKCPY